ncbi:MAG: hypothetical protein LBM41_06185 [Ruminococcus sp.]|jgi:hypothetical protein|nr:hypothetical protein [Ruminococcus sp.]
MMRNSKEQHKAFYIPISVIDSIRYEGIESYFNVIDEDDGGKQKREFFVEGINDYLIPIDEVLNSVDAAQLMDDCFSQKPFDIFISHSHENEDDAIALSLYIKEKYKKDCFIDSLVWEYSKKIINRIKSQFSLSREELSYTQTNVHIMLATSLMKMIRDTKKFIFIKSSESTLEENIGDVFTGSPWIYFELLVANMMINKTSSMNESVSFMYPIDDLIKDFERISDLKNLDKIR